MRNILFGLLFLLVAPWAQANDLTASVLGQYGKSYGHGHLDNFLDKADIYRVKVFGGAKLKKISWLSAVGLGLDFSYSSFLPRIAEDGFRYDRFQWDLFVLPFSIGWLVFEPGFSWVITDVKLPSKGVEDTSIRPGALINIGLRIPILSWFMLRADARLERVMKDEEKTLDGSQLNINGTFYSLLAGAEFRF